MEQEKAKIERLVKYINDCIVRGQAPILSKQEIKFLQANKEQIPGTPGTYYLL